MKAKTQVTTDANVLESISNEMDNVAAIREKLFTVYDIPVDIPKLPILEHEIDEPDTKVIYNSNGKFLGHVGRIYESIQPISFLDSLIGTIEGCESNLDLSQLEYREMKQGKMIEFRLPTDVISFKNARGKEDELKLFISFNTGFGGTARTELGLFSKRLICSNGMRIIQSETELRVKHTERMNQKAMVYCNELLQTLSMVSETSKVWKQMDSVQVSTETVEKFARLIAGVKKEETKETMSTRKANILNQVNEAITQEFQVTGTTVWGLLNGATRYTNHFASGHENEDYVLVNSGAKVNELAQREAMMLLN